MCTQEKLLIAAIEPKMQPEKLKNCLDHGEHVRGPSRVPETIPQVSPEKSVPDFEFLCHSFFVAVKRDPR